MIARPENENQRKLKTLGVLVSAYFGCAFLVFSGYQTPVLAQPMVDLDIIAQIESSNNPLAYNPKSKAMGMYQITPICLKEYNTWHPTARIAQISLYSPKVARSVAKWYLTTRIPQMLKFKALNDTIDNRLWAYNAGIGMVKRGIMPKETRQYILKYKKLQKERRGK